jgi:hypothetical protein
MDIQTEQQDKLAPYRGIAAEPRSKMTEAAKAKLNSITEQARLNVASDTRLVKEFTGRSWTFPQLMELCAKRFGISPLTGAAPRRNAIKLMHVLLKGAKVYRIADLTLLGELLPGEAVMPMNGFLRLYPLPEGETVTPTNEQPPSGKCKPKKRRRASRMAKDLVWSRTAKIASATPMESIT